MKANSIMGAGSPKRPQPKVHYAYPGATVSVCRRSGKLTSETDAVTCADCISVANEAAALLAAGAYCPRCAAGAAGGPEYCICETSEIKRSEVNAAGECRGGGRNGQRRKVWAGARRPAWRFTTALNVVHASALALARPRFSRRRARRPWQAPAVAPLRNHIDAAYDLDAGVLSRILGFMVRSLTPAALRDCAEAAHAEAARFGSRGDELAAAWMDEIALRQHPAVRVLGLTMLHRRSPTLAVAR